MGWIATAAVAIFASLLGALAGGYGSFVVQRRTQLREARTRLYLNHIVDFRAVATRCRDSVRETLEPRGVDDLQILCRDLYRDAVTSSGSDAQSVAAFVPQIEALRKVSAAYGARDDKSNDASVPLARELANDQLPTWDALCDDIGEYAVSLEGYLAGCKTLRQDGWSEWMTR
jgi:hypothetical protein